MDRGLKSFEHKHEGGEADDDTDCDGASVDRVLSPHSVDDGETELGEDNIGSGARDVGGTLDGGTGVATGERGRPPSLAPSPVTGIAHRRP